jgi:hypothetical protein
VLASAEPGLKGLTILSHRAEAIAACIHGAACLGDDLMLGRLLDALLAIARDPKLGSAQELTQATMRGLVALRRFGGVEPARALLEALAGVQARTSGDRIRLLSTVASGFVQLGEERSADALLEQLVRPRARRHPRLRQPRAGRPRGRRGAAPLAERRPRRALPSLHRPSSTCSATPSRRAAGSTPIAS